MVLLGTFISRSVEVLIEYKTESLLTRCNRLLNRYPWNWSLLNDLTGNVDRKERDEISLRDSGIINPLVDMDSPRMLEVCWLMEIAKSSKILNKFGKDFCMLNQGTIASLY
eukprot:NODE_152_length_16986_cov_0.478119.p14 type:complete len:111 gc:universal NODE_152_length_16986_cov_0.478119:13216-13548(+)